METMDEMTIVLCFGTAIITWVVTYVACRCVHGDEVFWHNDEVKWLNKRICRQSQQIIELRHQIVSERKAVQEDDIHEADWWKPAGWTLEGSDEDQA